MWKEEKAYELLWCSFDLLHSLINFQLEFNLYTVRIFDAIDLGHSMKIKMAAGMIESQYDAVCNLFIILISSKSWTILILDILQKSRCQPQCLKVNMVQYVLLLLLYCLNVTRETV